MAGILTLLYGVVCYTVFLGAFLYAIAFTANAGVARSIDVGPSAPTAVAVVIDIALLSLFAVQHTVMARPRFKRWVTRYIPAAIERSTFVLLASLVLILLFWQWR
ncbi:MAG: isoprenylcysteine carboxylmethyltransferase family protein, partial [Polyangiaceae bacterium]|nr:isoprenylcysteine carboxylmethyltransferase family protein [Polyangiaceae bacterium]